jgi:hypothetical protein
MRGACGLTLLTTISSGVLEKGAYSCGSNEELPQQGMMSATQHN